VIFFTRFLCTDNNHSTHTHNLQEQIDILENKINKQNTIIKGMKDLSILLKNSKKELELELELELDKTHHCKRDV